MTDDEFQQARQITAAEVCKAFRVLAYVIGAAPRPHWFRRKVQRLSGYRLWL